MLVDTKQFQAALKLASLTIPSKIIIESAAFFLLSATEGELVIETNNYSQAVRTAIPCKGDLDPAFLPGEQLSAIIGNVSGDTVELTRDGNAVYIKSDAVTGRKKGTKLQVSELNFESFDSAWGSAEPIVFTLPGKELEVALSAASAIIEAKAPIEAMRGVGIEARDGKLMFYGGDGFGGCMHILDAEFGVDGGLEFSTVIAPTDVTGVVKGVTDPVQISITRGKIKLVFGKTTYYQLLIEANYPEFYTAFNRIVDGVDFSPVSTAQLRDALKDCLALGAEVALLSVTDDGALMISSDTEIGKTENFALFQPSKKFELLLALNLFQKEIACAEVGGGEVKVGSDRDNIHLAFESAGDGWRRYTLLAKRS